MNFGDWTVLLCGLSLFLYGMHGMSAGLEAAAGQKLQRTLAKLTENRGKGVAVGTVITALIQSSSAVTVMVVGFVNSGMMTFRQSVGVIMGANIGTTVTAQMVAFDIGAAAPFIAFSGIILVLAVKNPRIGHMGEVLAGLGILFIGLEMMSGAMMPLRESELFLEVITKCSDPLTGILTGALFAALIQSSSASVGILQALAAGGAVPFGSAVYVLFGQNIGTCITAMLASVGTNRNAKRAMAVHLLFNVIGTAVFAVLCAVTPLTGFVKAWTPGRPALQIANMHTLFNVATTVLLFPFGNLLADFAERVLPDT